MPFPVDTPRSDPALPGLADAQRPVPLTRFERRFGHPAGLVVLFFSEMWERFSYYGMRGLLKLYLANFLFTSLRQVYQGQDVREPGDPNLVLGNSTIASILHLPASPAEQATIIYGWYTALVYLTPIAGGIVADRWLGQRKTVVVGGVLMAIGQFVLAFENYFYLGLLLLIIGNGGFKPNVSTQVGNLYAPGDERRDRAYAIYYVGINLGAFLGSIACGVLAKYYGWRYGFAAAGVGMTLGLIVYLAAGHQYLADDRLTRQRAERAEKAETPAKKPFTREEWNRTLALCALCALNATFWAVYEQQGNTMQTWADEQTVWPTILGFQVPATWFQSVNAFFIILLTPAIAGLWRYQAKRGKEPTSVSKMAIGCVILGLSYIIMVVGARALGNGRGSWLWPVSATLVVTVGELYLSPIGLSLVTKVAPARIVSMMMGVWFLSNALGNLLSGYIGVLYTRWPKDLFFALLLALGVGTGLAIWAFNRPLKRAIGHNV
jgi:POT family proton-dependent oligopeptide transporter